MYNQKLKALILTGSYGEGHYQVAHAIEEAIKLKKLNLEPIIVDITSYRYAFVSNISRRIFIKGVTEFPSFYNYLYTKSREANYFSAFLKVVGRTGVSSILELVNKLQPGIVISTFPFAAGMMSYLKKRNLTNIPTVTIITDYTVHSMWIYPYTDQYIVGTYNVSSGLNQRGVNDELIKVTGIPIHPKFSNFHPKDKIKQKYGLKHNIPTMLIMGGGYGLIGGLDQMIHSLEECPFELQIIIICGHNRKIKKSLESSLKYSKHHIRIMGFVTYIDELMAICDVMVTKAGGITITEGLALNIPILLYQPLGGQEQDNTKFLVETNAGVLVKDASDLKANIVRLLGDGYPIHINQRNSFVTKQQKHSAFHAVNVIQSLILNNTPH
ncbi:1,2-diacylglycerol 3-glucosyltransferase [Priestia megaterium]|uniref:MGDG synthase family glycosyltransferase n=1 Tax=Priestia megaterium TaxID=1404 RepID=UPI000BF50BD2|nr:glycosyltransferase [Priestia megaterium]PFK67538.1 1,2-diacylglycerol 3-glucosyltransferase [Priestia megaterium]